MAGAEAGSGLLPQRKPQLVFGHALSSIHACPEAGSKSGKSSAPSLPAQPPKSSEAQPENASTTDMGLSVVNHSLKCPECGSNRLYRDGFRYLADGSQVQRWLCRDCSYVSAKVL